MAEFCPKCRKILVPQQKYGKIFVKCDSCSYYKEEDVPMIESENFNHEKKGEGVIDDGNEYADYDNVCKKCGYDKAEVIDQGPSYSDENNVILLRCGKCGYSERVGGKTT